MHLIYPKQKLVRNFILILVGSEKVIWNIFTLSRRTLLGYLALYAFFFLYFSSFPFVSALNLGEGIKHCRKVLILWTPQKRTSNKPFNKVFTFLFASADQLVARAELRVAGLITRRERQQYWRRKHRLQAPYSTRGIKRWAPFVEISVHVNERSGGRNYPRFYTAASLMDVVVLQR